MPATGKASLQRKPTIWKLTTDSCAGASYSFGWPTHRRCCGAPSNSTPRFAPAFAFLAGAQVIDCVNGWSASPAQTLEEAEKVARQAVQLDERYPYALGRSASPVFGLAAMTTP